MRRRWRPASAARRWCWRSPARCTQLPGFAEGDVSVQDAAAQRAAPLLLDGAGLPPRARACSTPAPRPGGKTAHLLELADLDLLALDSDAAAPGPRRRHAAPAAACRPELQAGDAGQPAAWWDGRPFDAILLDAPCSASGIVRRHPDVRWLRRAGDIAALARAAGAAARRAVAAAQARRAAALLHLLGLQGRGPGSRSTLFCNATAPRRRRLRPRLARPSAAAARQSADDAAPAASVAADGFFYALIRKALRHRLPMTRDAPLARLAPAAACCSGLGARLLVLLAWRAAPRPAQRAQGGRAGRASRSARGEDGVLTLDFDARLRPAAAASKTRCSAACRCTSSPRPTLFRSRWYWRDERVARVHAQLAHGLPAADVDLARQLRRPEPELPDPGRGAGRGVAQLALEGRRAGAARRRIAATTSSSATGSTPRSCRGRCRSASAARPTGCWSIERSSAPRMSALTRAAPARRHEPQGARWAWLVAGVAVARRRPGAGLRAVARRPAARALLRAPLRLAVLGQRGAWRRCWSLVIAVAAVRLALRVRRGKFGSRLLTQAGRHLRAGRRACPGVLIYTVSLPVRLAQHRELVRREGGRARSTPA